MRIIVTFATKYGSTKEVAAVVAEALRERDLETDVRPVRAVDSLGDYGLVVLGAALYRGKLHRHAHRFLSRHREDLSALPVALFALGPRTPKEEGAWPRSQEQLAQELAGVPWLRPFAVELFGGADPPHPKKPRRDERDWHAIRAWGEKLAAWVHAQPDAQDS